MDGWVKRAQQKERERGLTGEKDMKGMMWQAKGKIIRHEMGANGGEEEGARR